MAGKGFVKVGLGVLLTAAAAGTGYYVWQQRKAAAVQHLSGEGEWGAGHPSGAEVFEHGEPVAAFQPGMADTQSPDVVDEQFGRDVDAEADQLAEEIVEAVEVPETHLGHHEEAPVAEAEPFEPGMADTQSPDVVDEQFGKEVDAAADELAEEIVEGVEEPKG
jgi:hypothetical protein